MLLECRVYNARDAQGKDVNASQCRREERTEEEAGLHEARHVAPGQVVVETVAVHEQSYVQPTGHSSGMLQAQRYQMG